MTGFFIFKLKFKWYFVLYNNLDEFYIKKCFELAKKGIGKVSPNPLVGAVIVKDNLILSEGYHSEFGKMHAEADALSKLNDQAIGATLYCNLEPCCHTNKKTPPCVPQIIKAGIKKVVISNLDPNPNVAGKGTKQLIEAGIEVVINILEDEGKELNKFFFKYITQDKPYICIKIATTLDNKIAAEKGKQTWITGKKSQIFVHNLRNLYDAVLVGAGTVLIDNPSLNVRFIEGRNPYKIILDKKLITPIDALVYTKEPEKTILFCSEVCDRNKITELLNKKVNIIELNSIDEQNLNLNNILEGLRNFNISSVLIEGGANIFSQFIEQNLYDEIIILKAPKIFGSGQDAFVNLPSKDFSFHSVEKLGEDIKIIIKKE